MDPILVEKITKLVLSKLGELSASDSHSIGLSKTEIERWENISYSLRTEGISNFSTRHSSQSQNELKPLTRNEIEKWEQVSRSINIGPKTYGSNIANNGSRVTFHHL